MSPPRSPWITAAWVLSMVLVFVGERLLGAGRSRVVLTGLGVALAVLSLALRIVRSLRADAQHRSAERSLAVLSGLGLLGLALYFLQSDAWVQVSGTRLSESSPRLALVLSALYPVFIALSLLPTLLAEAAYASVVRAPRVEVRRIRDAVGTGVGLVAVLVFAFAAEYVTDARDQTWDFSYFRTAKSGDGTQKLVRNLGAPLEISLFFPPANDVQQEVVEYFRPLQSESSQLHVSSYDAALDIAKAKELGVSSNGAIVLQSGQRKETVVLSLELERARGELRKLDQTIQDKMFMLTRPRKTLYLTTGHGERTDRMGNGPAQDARAHIILFKQRLEALNQDVKPLGAADGLATDVPLDAGAVLVVGPTSSFLPEELAALTRYFARGGRLLVALDPESSTDLSPLLTPMGVAYQKTQLVNDRTFVPYHHTPSDRANLVAATFSSHPVVTTVSQSSGHLPLIFVGAGWLEELKSKPVQLQLDFAVRSLPTTFNDLNGNFAQDPPLEFRKGWPIVAAASRHTFGEKGEKPLDSRAVIVADSDWVSDFALETAGNAVFAHDAMVWLIGEEAVAGAANKETDVRIEHTHGQDTAYFYLTIFGVPALFLGAGALGTRRRRTKRAGR